MSYFVWDLETTTKELHGRKASPFCAENWVVASGVLSKGRQPDFNYYGKQRPEDGWLVPVLQNCKVLVGFNIKFDLLHAIQQTANYAAFKAWVTGGGRIWDCQLAEYLLEGMARDSHMLSLDQVAARYGGDLKVNEVKALWAAGVCTSDINPDLLKRYLVGDETTRGDLGNTELVFLEQVRKARLTGQINSILLNMSALLFTVEAEHNGMHVDRDLGMRHAGELQSAIATTEAELNKLLPSDLPFTFNWSSRTQLSAFIFGGEVGYTARQYKHSDGTTTRVDEWAALPDNQRKALTYPQCTVKEPLLDELGLPVLYKSGKNAGTPKFKNVQVDNLEAGPKMNSGEFTYRFARQTAPRAEWLTEVPGVYSVSSDVLEALGGCGIPLVKEIVKFFNMQKDLTTYYVSPTGDKGMLTLVDQEGLIHHNLNMVSTVTGRLSSSRPNLQNLSKGNKSRVKELFTSRFQDGVIIQSDFSSLEVYVQANLTGCKNLIEDLKAGIDMHCMRLAVKEKMQYGDVLALCKGPAAVKEWEYKRTAAKVMSFQKAYGAGNQKIADSTGMSIEEVEAFSQAEDLRYPEIARYFEDLTEKIKAARRPYKVAPHPQAAGVMAHIGRATVSTPDGKIYAYFEEPAPDWLLKKNITASFSPTQIKNYSVQGAGAEWAKAAMSLAVRAFYAADNFNGRALLVNQVHDAVYVDAAPEVAKVAIATLHACMTLASQHMEQLFQWPLDVHVPSETKYGASMAEENAVVFDSALLLEAETTLLTNFVGKA